VLDIGPGDEVLVPDFTYPATADVVLLVGAEPILIDVDVETYNIDTQNLEESITEKTKCIMPVSLFGNPVDMKPLWELQEKYNFHIVEDSACSAGASIDGKKVGTLADLSCFSFHPRKVITTGEGGMITTNNDEYAERARQLKKFGLRATPDGARFMSYGTNYKLSNVLGAIGLAQLTKIDQIIENRIQLAGEYTKLLSEVNNVVPPKVKDTVRHTYQSYTLRLEKEGIRDKILADMRAKGIECQIGTYSLSLEPAFKNTKRIGDLEISHKLFHNLLTLPMHHELTQDDQVYVVETLKELIDKY
jgi:dTDP-4-amino-4,6-dideoxygalactose transaminase